MALTFVNLYTSAARWANDTSTNGLNRAKDAVIFALRELEYGTDDRPLRPWWRKREDTITPVAGTQTYAFPTNQGTIESPHEVWYRLNGIRTEIPIVDDRQWSEEADEDTTVTGTPDICNIHQSSGTVNVRFSLTPSSSFISAITGGVLRLDFFILDPLTATLVTDTSLDSDAPLLPESRRPGAIWKAVEMLAALQGDRLLLEWAAAQGRKYYNMILADDLSRLGKHQRIGAPLERPGDVNPAGRLTDYGHVIR